MALDSTSGKQVWAYQLASGDQPSERGVAYWPGAGKTGARIVFGTVRGSLIALSARTGEPAAGFGQNGIVDLKTPEILNGIPNAPYGLTSPPTIYKNLAIIGRYVLRPEIFEVLERTEPGKGGEIQLTDALQELAVGPAWTGGVHGVVFRGRRYDTGDRLDYLKAIVQLASDRDDLGSDFRTWLRDFSQTLPE